MTTITFVCSNNKLISYMKAFYVENIEQLLFTFTMNDRRAMVLLGTSKGLAFIPLSDPKDKSGGVIMTNRKRNNMKCLSGGISKFS